MGSLGAICSGKSSNCSNAESNCEMRVKKGGDSADERRGSFFPGLEGFKEIRDPDPGLFRPYGTSCPIHTTYNHKLTSRSPRHRRLPGRRNQTIPRRIRNLRWQNQARRLHLRRRVQIPLFNLQRRPEEGCEAHACSSKLVSSPLQGR